MRLIGRFFSRKFCTWNITMLIIVNSDWPNSNTGTYQFNGQFPNNIGSLHDFPFSICYKSAFSWVKLKTFYRSFLPSCYSVNSASFFCNWVYYMINDPSSLPAEADFSCIIMSLYLPGTSSTVSIWVIIIIIIINQRFIVRLLLGKIRT